MPNKNELNKIFTLEPKFIFGFATGSSKNCVFLNDKKIIYHASGVLVVHDLTNNSQQIIRMNDPQKIVTLMELNYNKNLLAVVETGKRPAISIYDLVKFKHKRRLIAPLDMKSKGFIKIQFTWDSVYLAALTDEPDYVMYYYNWQSSKVESHVQVIHPPTVVGPVADMALNPAINGVCCFVGKGLFRLMKLGELVWKQSGFHKATKFEFTSVCWLNENSIVACTADGRLFLVDNGELKAVYKVCKLIDFDIRKTMKNPLEVKTENDDTDFKIGPCLPIKSGLMLVVNNYSVHYYKTTSDGRYSKYFVFAIERDERLESIDEDPELHAINTLIVNPENKIIVCTTKRNQLFWAKIRWKTEHSEVPIKPFSETLHHGGVSGLSVCTWKPLFATSGQLDRTVKLWNYESCSMLLSVYYTEDVTDVSLHPTGLYALVATVSRVIFCVVHVDTMKPKRSFDVPGGCPVAKFSDAGHMFAIVVDLSTVHVYSTITFQRLFEFANNKGAITSLTWAVNDLSLYSCDDEGFICQFDMYTGKYELEISNQFPSTVAVSKLGRQYMALQDGTLKEMNNQAVVRTINLDHGPLNGIILSRSNSVLFVTCQSGAILSLKFPIKSDAKFKYKEFVVHNSSVTKMKLVTDETTLISCSADGIICVWNLKNLKEKFAGNLQKSFVDNMLISSTILKGNANRILELSLKSNKLRNQFAEDQVKHTGAHEKHLLRLYDQHSLNIKRLENKIKEMVAKHDARITYLKDTIDGLKTEHELKLKNARDNYADLLAYEYEKREKLNKEILDTQANFDNEARTLALTLNDNLRELADTFDENIKTKEEAFEKSKEQLKDENSEMHKKIDKFDDQADREILELDISYIYKSKKLSAAIRKAEERLQQYHSKVNALMKREADVTYLVDKYRNDIKELKVVDKKFDKKIMDKNDKVTEWNEIIQNRDDEMDDLKLKIKRVEIEKLVLQYNRDEQLKVIEPLRNTLRNLTITNQEMKKQLWNTEVIVKHLAEECVKCRQNIRSNAKSVQDFQKMANNQATFIKDLIIDFNFGFSSVKSEEKLKQIILDTYNKNFANANLPINLGVKSDMLREKEFLERMRMNIYNQKTAAVKKKPLYVKALEKNKILLETINGLRRKLEIEYSIVFSGTVGNPC